MTEREFSTSNSDTQAASPAAATKTVAESTSATPRRPSTAPSRFTFIGVTTGKSAIMRVFPKWAEHLGLGGVVMAGCDLPIHAEPACYRTIVSALKADPLDLGGLVTTHKIDLFAACRDMFDYVDPYAELCGETSCISKRAGELRAHAKDPISSGRSIDEFIPQNYWDETGGEVLLFGAGGSNLAITLHLMTAREPHDRPRRIVVINRSAARLASMRALHERLGTGVRVEYIENADASENDRLVTALPTGSLVINGTGMGKDIPGSPITSETVFPERGFVWELNYRGELDFLHLAERQQRVRSLKVEDGWRYFVHGWTSVIEEVFDIAITPSIVDELAKIALPLRGA